MDSKRKPPLWAISYQSLLWNKNISNIMQWIFLVLANLHCISILISFQLHFITIDDQTILVKSVKSLSESLIFKSVANFQGGNNQTIVAIVIMISIYFLSFMVLHLTNLWTYSQNKKPKSWKETLNIIFAQFHLSIGFWMINAFLMDYIHDVGNKDSSSLFALSILLIVFNYIFAGLFSLYSYDPFLSPNVLSSSTPVYQVLTTLFKAIAAPLIFFSSPSDSSATKWPFVATSLIILATRQYHLLSRFSYCKYSTMKFCVIFGTISCLLIFLIFLALAINSKTVLPSQTLIFTQLLLIPFVVYAALVSFKKIIFQYLSKQNSELKTPQDALKKIFAIFTISEKTRFIFSENIRRNLYELGFWYLLEANNNSDFAISHKSYNKVINSLIEKLLNEMVQKFPSDIRLKILQIHFGLQLNKHIEILTFYLRELTQVHHGQAQFLTHQLSHKLQENMNHFIAENKPEIIDIRQYIDQENLSETFARAIKDNVQGYLDFWKDYLKSQVNIKQLYLRSKKIEKGADFIENFWNKNSETNKLFALTFYTTYSPYLRLLRAAPFQSYKLAQKYAAYKQEEIYKAYQEGFNVSSLTDLSVICVHTCMNQENPGKILKVTSNIIGLAGWFPQEVINENISLLMPGFMAYDHQKLLSEHLKNLETNEKPNRMHQTLATFLLHKSGHILPCDIYLTFHPEIQENPVYVGFIKIKQLVTIEQILLNESGEIEGFTKEFGELLGLGSHIKTNLNSLCTNFSEIRGIMKTLTLQETKQSLIYFQHLEEFSCLVDVSLHSFRKKPYYILSLSLPEKEKNKLKLKIDDPYLSGEFDEFPKTQKNQNNKVSSPRRLLVTSPTRKTIQTEEGEGIITTTNYDEEKFPTRCQRQQQTRNLLTSHDNGGIIHTVDSFLVEDHYNPSLVTTQRSLIIGLSPRKHLKQPESLIKTPTYADSTMKRTKTRLEVTLPMIPKYSFVGLFFLCMVLLMVVSAIPLIIFQSKASDTLALVHRNGETLSSLIYMLAEYADLHGNTRAMWQGELGIFGADRWNRLGYHTSALDNIFWYLSVIASIVKDGNNDVRSNVYQLDPEIKKEMYQGTVPVHEMQDDGSIGSTRRDTLFDLSTELFSQAIKFVNTADLPYNPTNPYMMFILNNTMNESLVLGEKEISILTEDNPIKLHSLNSFIYAMMIMVSLLAVSVFGFFILGVQKFLQERNHFLDIFAILNEASIVEHLHLLKDFKECLMLTSFSEKDKKLQSFRSGQNSPGRRRRRRLNRSGINNLLIILHLATFIFLFLVFSAYPILYSQVGPGNEALLRKMDLMVQSNMNCYYTVLGFNVVYIYVQEPNSQVKNMPIETAWLEIYQKLAAVQDFISDDLLDPKTGMGSDPVIYKNAVGNLCDMYYFDDPIVMGNCQTIGGGFLTKGVSGMNSFFMAYSQAMYLYFKNSNQTLAASREALDNTQAVIWEAFYPFIYISYEMIDEHIRNAMVKDFDQLSRSILQVMVAFIVIYAVIGGWVAWKIQKVLKVEMMDWRKMLRRIPYPVANENQHLKAFLKKTTGFL